MLARKIRLISVVLVLDTQRLWKPHLISEHILQRIERLNTLFKQVKQRHYQKNLKMIYKNVKDKLAPYSASTEENYHMLKYSSYAYELKCYVMFQVNLYLCLLSFLGVRLKHAE